MRFQIEILGLELFGHHGVLQHEKDYGQTFFVDIKLVVAASGQDDISKTVSYADVADLVAASFNAERNDLLEALSARLQQTVLSLSEQILSCEVAIHKPAAPLNQKFNDVIVTALASA